MGGISDITSMVSSLQQSIDAAVKKAQKDQGSTQKTGSADKVYEQDTRKSSSTLSAYATDMGYLIKDKTRLNSFSILAKSDPVDFYKFKVTTKGEVGLGRVGDDGLRVQLMDKAGKIVADSSGETATTKDAYTKWTKGQLPLDKGDYTVRVTRDKGVAATAEKQYALQLTQGAYTTDYDTYAKQPQAGDSAGGTQVPSYVRTLQSLMGASSVTSSNLTNLLLGGSSSSSSSSSGRGSLLNGLF